MKTNFKAFAPGDRRRINIFDDDEANYWAHELGVSRGLLEAVVRKLGTSVIAVRRELAR